MTVLVVDDEAGFRSAMRRALPGWVRTAQTIGEGLRIAGEWQPAVALIDVHFVDERRSGLDALVDFRRAAPRTQLVAMSALYVNADAERALREGAVGYVEKIDYRYLRRVVVAARTLVPSVFVPGPSRLQ